MRITKRASFGLVLGLLSRGTLAAQSTDPDWNHKPSEAEIERLYPEPAKKLGKEGRVVLNCGVSALGRTHDCGVAEENPKGLGFGQAATLVMATATFKPATEMGHPIEAVRPISVPIDFKLSAATDQQDSSEGLWFGALLFIGFGIQVFRAFTWGVVSGRSGGEAQRKRSPALFWLGTVVYTLASATGRLLLLPPYNLGPGIRPDNRNRGQATFTRAALSGRSVPKAR